MTAHFSLVTLLRTARHAPAFHRHGKPLYGTIQKFHPGTSKVRGGGCRKNRIRSQIHDWAVPCPKNGGISRINSRQGEEQAKCHKDLYPWITHIGKCPHFTHCTNHIVQTNLPKGCITNIFWTWKKSTFTWGSPHNIKFQKKNCLEARFSEDLRYLDGYFEAVYELCMCIEHFSYVKIKFWKSYLKTVFCLAYPMWK